MASSSLFIKLKHSLIKGNKSLQTKKKKLIYIFKYSITLTRVTTSVTNQHQTDFKQDSRGTATYIPAMVRLTPHSKAAVHQWTGEKVQVVRGTQGGLVQSAGSRKAKQISPTPGHNCAWKLRLEAAEHRTNRACIQHRRSDSASSHLHQSQTLGHNHFKR